MQVAPLTADLRVNSVLKNFEIEWGAGGANLHVNIRDSEAPLYKTGGTDLSQTGFPK